MTIRKSLLGLTAGAMALVGAAPAAMAGEFDGVTVNILTRPGYVIAGRLVERGVEFQEATGAKIVVTEVPYAEIFPKIQSDWSTCLLYTSPSPRDKRQSRMPSSA